MFGAWKQKLGFANNLACNRDVLRTNGCKRKNYFPVTINGSPILARATSRMYTGTVFLIIRNSAGYLLLMLIRVIFVIPLGISSRIRQTQILEIGVVIAPVVSTVLVTVVSC